MREATGDHSFVRHPHRTLVRLTVPVLISLIAEPLTGLADTAFVARLGATPLAALGVGTVLLSSVFWVFNFLGIGTQTEVAHALGNPGDTRARDANGLALALSLPAVLASTDAHARKKQGKTPKQFVYLDGIKEPATQTGRRRPSSSGSPISVLTQRRAPSLCCYPRRYRLFENG